MSILFETIKLIFFFLTILIALIFFQGGKIFNIETTKNLYTILTPAYLIFIGLLLAYILALTMDRPENTHQQRNKLYIKMFLGGLLVGTILALLSIFS